MRLYSNIVSKYQQHGAIWLLCRGMREFSNPSNKLLSKLGVINTMFAKLFAGFGKLADNLRGATDNKNLYLFYDLEVSPITFDICWSLAIAEHLRQKYQLAKITLVIVPGRYHNIRPEDSAYENTVNAAERNWRIYNLLMPMANLLENIQGVIYAASRDQAAQLRSQVKYVTPENYQVSVPIPSTSNYFLRNRCELRQLRATTTALTVVNQWLEGVAKNRKVISVTIRNYPYLIARNSNIAAWAEFLKGLDLKQYAIIIIPDTRDALSQNYQLLAPVAHFIPAAWNVDLRAALYESCYLNLGVNTGPMALCWLNKKCRYITFKMICEDVSLTSKENMQQQGFMVNQSLPFANAMQKWVWQPDNVEILQHEFTNMCDVIENNFKKPVSYTKQISQQPA